MRERTQKKVWGFGNEGEDRWVFFIGERLQWFWIGILEERICVRKLDLFTIILNFLVTL